jgi:diguanylate cyclase
MNTVSTLEISYSFWAIAAALAAGLLATGFAAGWLVFRSRGQTSQEAERAMQVIKRLQDLATSVAQDVGAHNSRVQQISTGLSEAPAQRNSQWDEVVIGSVAEIIKANEQLQQQLSTAEVRLQRQAEELETQVAVARTDALTTLYNRRAFDDELARRFAEWQRCKTVFSLMMIDVDFFKKFNDQHGHQAGDLVLRTVAGALYKTMREMDLVARYGGEEFAIILPVTSLADSLRAAERARAAVADGITQFAGTELRVTTSVGVAQVSVGDTHERIVQRADEALYAAKSAGRNRVWYQDGRQCLAAAPAAAPQPAAAEQTPAPAQAAAGPRGLTAFCTDLRRRVLECQKYNVPLSLVLLDIDEFKTITDKLGSSGRELVVETINDFLGTALQEIDLVSRYGDGRFAIMMPGSDLGTAAGVAERIRATIDGAALQVGAAEMKFTVSLGLAQAQAADDASSLIKRADAALFASKAGGGNTAHLHNGTTCEPIAGAMAVC